MTTTKATLLGLAAAAGFALSGALVAANVAFAMAPAPAPAPTQCEKFKKGSKEWKKCVGQVRDDMSDDELYYAGYWLTRSGEHQAALAYLERARNKDARILTYIGYTTRKLGDRDAAMGYYARALAMNPDYTVARAYLGEALLDMGRTADAKAELSEIARRCGTTCPEHQELAAAITKAETKGL